MANISCTVDQLLFKDRIQRLFQTRQIEKPILSQVNVNAAIFKQYILEHVHQVTNIARLRWGSLPAQNYCIAFDGIMKDQSVAGPKKGEDGSKKDGLRQLRVKNECSSSSRAGVITSSCLVEKTSFPKSWTSTAGDCALTGNINTRLSKATIGESPISQS